MSYVCLLIADGKTCCGDQFHIITTSYQRGMIPFAIDFIKGLTNMKIKGTHIKYVVENQKSFLAVLEVEIVS